MRFSVLLGLLAVAGTSVAHPRRSEGHPLRARAAGDTVTITVYSTEKTPSVTVYVNPKGVTLSVVSASAKTTQSLAAGTNVAVSVDSTSALSTTSSVTTIDTVTTTQASPVSSTTSTTNGTPAVMTATLPLSKIRGVVYSPYKVNDASGNGCKSAAQIKLDIAQIPSDYNIIRLYGVDCSQVQIVAPLAKARGMQLFLGVWDVTRVASDITAMGLALNGDWSAVHTVSIGNEVVNSVLGQGAGTISAAVKSVTTGVALARTLLAGKNVKIVTTDTFNAAMSYPALCKKTDYIAVNMHPYFNPNVDGSAASVAAFMQGSIADVVAKCGARGILITETGWPWKQTGGSTVDTRLSIATQKTAIQGIAQAQRGFILLSAYNDPWKNPGPQGTEQWWGLGGKNAPSQQA